MKSFTKKNLTDSGYTTYHSDGSTSKTYRHTMDDGFTTYHSDGSTTKTYKNLTNDGYTSYTDGRKHSTYGGSGLETFGAMFVGILLLGFSVICSFVILKETAIGPITIIAASFLVASILSRKIGSSNAFLLMNPFFLYGIQQFLSLTWEGSSGFDFIVGMPGFLGGIVIEIVFGLFILIGKIGEEDEKGYSNTFLLILSFIPTFMAPCSAVVGFPADMVFYMFDSLLLFLTIIVVAVRCTKKGKIGKKDAKIRMAHAGLRSINES